MDSVRDAGSIRIELASRVPAERAPGSGGWIVVVVPRASDRTSTGWKRPGSKVASGLGTLEPAGPGTATVARRTMSAILATTLRRRTLRGPYHGNRCQRDFHAIRDQMTAASQLAPRGTRTYRLDGPLDLVRTLAVLSHGRPDPTIRLVPGRVWWTTRTPDGPASLALVHAGDRVTAEAHGPGAERVLAQVPALLGGLGGHDGHDPWTMPVNAHPLVVRLARIHAGIRIPRTGAVLESLVPAILEQKVTSGEAHRAYRGLVRVHGEPAPGPSEWRLRLQPPPAALASLPYYAYHPFGVEQRRAELIRRVAGRATWFEAITDLPTGDAYARLTAVPVIGPWTAAEIGVRVLGDPDAVSVGDFHLPNLVAFALAGEPRADDARMLELLEPWRGERARVVRLLELSGIQAPRYGPRLTPHRIEDD